MSCTWGSGDDDLMALQDGRLSIEARFRLARHVRGCKQCKLQLLIMLESAQDCDHRAACEIRAVAVSADVDPANGPGWLFAMFAKN